MTCPKCGSTNVNVQIVDAGSTTRKKGNGCLWSIGRALLIFCTLGLWLLIGKRKGKNKTVVHNEKQAVCQSCGQSWKV